MYVHVKSFDGKQKITLTTSRLTTIGAFKRLVEAELNVRPKYQRLFFRGKQLENGYSLFDYDVNLNDVIQLMIQPSKDDEIQFSDDKTVFHGFNSDFNGFDETEELSPTKTGGHTSDFNGFSDSEISDTLERVDQVLNHFNCLETKSSKECREEPSSSNLEIEEKSTNLSLFYRVNDIVDIRDNEFGSWFEGKVVEILYDLEKKHFDRTDPIDDGLLYRVILLRFPEDDPTMLKVGDIRPRARQKINLSDINIGDKIMVNYNVEEPRHRGYWYDLCVTKKKPLVGTLFVGTENAQLDNTHIRFTDELFRIEKHCLLAERSPEEVEFLSKEPPFKRQYAPYCSQCQDCLTVKCKECSCNLCGGKDEPDKQVMCDECSMVFHLWCLLPPLSELPDIDYWYCADCKNDENEIVKAGDKLKESKKKAKMPSTVNKSSRDWGKGMACVGRTKECTIVPINHFGPIPGIEVGTSWKFRVQVSEAGVHRPHVAGIAGRENLGAYSIVFSGGYEGDRDEGDEFLYTGSGGRDLSGNKRIAEQSSDQTLSRMNKALALNCNAAVDEVKGAEAVDWRGGKPVRVVRNYKAYKHSKYSPQEGNRYDGIYKVVKYFPEKGASGYIVWRFLLRRDDPAPAPWTPEGKERIASLGLELLYPDGYLEAMKSKEKKEKEKSMKNNGNKRKSDRIIFTDKSNDGKSSESESPATKITKYIAYKLTNEESQLIDKDCENTKLWDLAKEALVFGKQKFLSKIEEVFMCVCCQEVLYKPITTPCNHNICESCLKRSFAAEVYICPYCRNDLTKDYVMRVNDSLQDILSHLFPGYNCGR